MPDASSYKDRPLDWGDAFQQLPLAQPDVSAWPAMSNALREHHARRGRGRGIAMAAGVAAVLAVPCLVLFGGNGQDAAGPASARVPAIGSGPDLFPLPVTAGPSDTGTPAPNIPPARSSDVGPSSQVARAVPGVGAQVDVASARPGPRHATRARAGLGAAAASNAASSRSVTDQDPAPVLASLQAESAQLEQLLLLARDEQVASGVTVALRDAQLERITAIDAALIDDSDPGQRTALWQARVDALRDAATFESARRWNKAQGLSMDAALVRVD